MENRHYCTYCGRKQNESKMILFWYPLLKKKAWHCKACFANFPLLPYKIESY